ncbi:MAG TPA: hypothetical protein VKU82_10220 [Planctomycetaceae bacterium]|nr:hypothetical protein [Planctomycetaceae bacterium]
MPDSLVTAPGALYAQAYSYQQLGRTRRAVEAAKHYAAAVGGGPTAWQFLAETYTQLGERKAAAENWTKLLGADPDNAEALASLAGLLDEKDSRTILEFLQRTSRPRETVAAMAARHFGIEPAVLRVIAEFAAEASPESANESYILGLAAQAEGDDETAAAFFKTAFESETDEEVRQTYVGKFIDAMSAAGQLIAGYEQAPDPKAAFRRLVEGDGEEDSGLAPNLLQSLLDAHRRKYPDDPWLHYHSGFWLEQKHDLASARAELAAALENAEDDLQREQFRAATVGLMHRAGDGLTAYQTVQPIDATFRQLAEAYRWDPRGESFKDIVKLHEMAHPGDPALAFATAVVELHNDNAAEALRLALIGYDTIEEPALKSACQSLALGLAVKTGDFVVAYRVSPDGDEALRLLANRFAPVMGRDSLKIALERHVTRHPATQVWWYFQAEQRWNAKDYEGVVESVGLWDQSSGGNLNDWEIDKLREWLIRSLLHLGRKDEALRTAWLMYDSEGIALPLLFVQLDARHVGEVQRLMEECAFHSYQREQLFTDPDAGPVLRSSEFLPVRMAFPPELPDAPVALDFVLLLKEPAPLSQETIAESVNAAMGNEAVIESLPGLPAQQISGWLVRSPKTRIVVSAGGKPYKGDWDEHLSDLKNDELKKAVAEHHGWIAVSLAKNDGFDSSLERPSLDLLDRFLSDNCLALYDLNRARLIENSADLRAQLHGEAPLAHLETAGDPFWPAYELQSGTAGRKRDRAFSISLKRLVAAFDTRRPDQKFEIKVWHPAGKAADLLRLNVERCQKMGYQGVNFVGVLVEPSKILPQCTTGEPFAVRAESVIELMYTDGERVESASRWD